MSCFEVITWEFVQMQNLETHPRIPDSEPALDKIPGDSCAY